jgi:hypothetical protein
MAARGCGAVLRTGSRFLSCVRVSVCASIGFSCSLFGPLLVAWCSAKFVQRQYPLLLLLVLVTAQVFVLPCFPFCCRRVSAFAAVPGFGRYWCGLKPPSPMLQDLIPLQDFSDFVCRDRARDWIPKITLCRCLIWLVPPVLCSSQFCFRHPDLVLLVRIGLPF